MKTIGLLAIVTGIALGAVPVMAEDNVPPKGFKALFNGKDLEGWQGVVDISKRAKMTPEQLTTAQKAANEKVLPHWSAKNGVLHYDGKGDSLQTVKDYGDFELFCDFKIGKGGDSGLYVRGTPQIQIWDPEQHPEGSGGLFNNQKNPNKPLKKADKPVGEWNTFRIIMKGDRVTVYLNGELVVDNVPLENYWDRKTDPSKPLPAKGPIELQHHGNPLEFKNIYIKESE